MFASQPIQKLHMSRKAALVYLKVIYKKVGKKWVEKDQEPSYANHAVLWREGKMFWTFEGSPQDVKDRIAANKRLKTLASEAGVRSLRGLVCDLREAISSAESKQLTMKALKVSTFQNGDQSYIVVTGYQKNGSPKGFTVFKPVGRKAQKAKKQSFRFLGPGFKGIKLAELPKDVAARLRAAGIDL